LVGSRLLFSTKRWKDAILQIRDLQFCVAGGGRRSAAASNAAAAAQPFVFIDAAARALLPAAGALGLFAAAVILLILRVKEALMHEEHGMHIRGIICTMATALL